MLRTLFERVQEPLGLAPAGRGGRWAAARRSVTAGFFNPVHACTVQVLGSAASRHIEGLSRTERARLPARLKRKGLAVVIASPGAPRLSWRKFGIREFRCALAEHEVVHALRRELAELQCQRTTVHGVFLSVHGVGVLLTGASASGKSELALELLARGHVLIADDAVELARPAPGIIIGHCPPVLVGYMEVRELGVLDVRGMYGPRAVRERQRLDLIVRFDRGRRSRAADRLAGRRSAQRILGERMPVRSLPGWPGDNRAVRVEAACLDQALRAIGVSAETEFSDRQLKAIQDAQA